MSIYVAIIQGKLLNRHTFLIISIMSIVYDHIEQIISVVIIPYLAITIWTPGVFSIYSLVNLNSTTVVSISNALYEFRNRNKY